MKTVQSIGKLIVASVAVITTLGTTANAMTFRYKFKVASSGVSMYACNAGVMSQVTQLICVDKKNGMSYSGEAAKKYAESCSTAKENCNSSIVCSQQLGSTYINGMAAQVSPWTDHSEAKGAQSRKTVSAQINNKWSTLVNETDAVNTVVNDLSYMFMTELYNAKYFVDICVRAPQNASGSQGLGNSFNLIQKASGIPLIYTDKNIPGETDRTGVLIDESTSNYLVASGVKVQAYAVCDTLAANSSAANTTSNSAEFIYGADGVTPVSGKNGQPFYAYATPTVVNGSEVKLNDVSVGNPRFCKIRYVFTETNSSSANPKFRDWKLKGAEMCTFTEFNDPIQESATTSTY